MHEIKLGDTVLDSISGYQGIAIGRTEWIFGCIRWTVQAPGLHDGKPIDPISLDEGQAVWISSPLPIRKDEPVVIPPVVEAKKPGGPIPNPTRRAAATR